MSGLSVLLETTTTTAQQQQQLQCAGAAARTSTAAQVISKATFMNAATTNKIWVSPASSTCSSSSRAPIMAPPATAASCSFLQRCFLCRKELGDGVDIYIYRGDRAFCSEECRCRHILVEDSDGATDCARVAAAGRSRRRRRDVAGSGFAF